MQTLGKTLISVGKNDEQTLEAVKKGMKEGLSVIAISSNPYKYVVARKKEKFYFLSLSDEVRYHFQLYSFLDEIAEKEMERVGGGKIKEKNNSFYLYGESIEYGCPPEKVLEKMMEISRKACVKMKDISYLVHESVRNNDLPTPYELAEEGEDMKRKNKFGRMPLHTASIFGNPKAVELFIFLNHDLDAKDSINCTPLHYASEKGYLRIVKLLYYAGSELEAKDITGKTPIDYAKKRGKWKVAEYLSEVMGKW